MAAAAVPQTRSRINQDHKRRADRRQHYTYASWISLVASPHLAPVFLSPAVSLSSFPVFLFPTPFLFNLYRHTLAGTLTQYAVYTLSGGFKIQVRSPRSLIHTRSPSTFAHYLVLISLPLSGIILIPLFSHLLLIGTQLGEVFNKQQRFTWFLRRLLTHLACLGVMNKQCRSGALFSVCLCCVSSLSLSLRLSLLPRRVVNWMPGLCRKWAVSGGPTTRYIRLIVSSGK